MECPVCKKIYNPSQIQMEYTMSIIQDNDIGDKYVCPRCWNGIPWTLLDEEMLQRFQGYSQRLAEKWANISVTANKKEGKSK